MRALIALPLLAAAAASPAANADKPVKAEKERLVCRELPFTGTRISRSECHTAPEWKEIDAARAASFKEYTRRMNRGGAGGSLSPP